MKTRYRQCFDYLLNTSIDVNSRNLVENTPLHEAAFWGNYILVIDSKLLLIYQFIAVLGLEDIVIQLLENGADPTLKGNAGQTVLHILIDKALRNIAKHSEKNESSFEMCSNLVGLGSTFP